MLTSEVQKTVNQDIIEFPEAQFSETKSMNLEAGGRPDGLLELHASFIWNLHDFFKHPWENETVHLD